LYSYSGWNVVSNEEENKEHKASSTGKMKMPHSAPFTLVLSFIEVSKLTVSFPFRDDEVLYVSSEDPAMGN